MLEMRAKTQAGRQGRRRAGARLVRPSTVRQVYTVLRAGLDGAVRDGLIARNPAAAWSNDQASPASEAKPKNATATDVTKLLLVRRNGLRYQPALVLIAATGLRRRGEALALHWKFDVVNLD